MNNKPFYLFPDQASTTAPQVDNLFIFLCVLTAFFTLLIFGLIVYQALRFRRRTTVPPPRVHPPMSLEIAWTVIPFLLTMLIFFWGAKVYFYIYRAPETHMDIHAIGKQWMWKIQHPSGRREINELHVPLGQPIQVSLASQDVIHSFYIPAFRIKTDAVPGRYTKLWFQPTKLGEFHLFCAEYCGTLHSGMIGKVIVMEPEKYQAWAAGATHEESPAAAGAKLFQQYGCITCHANQAPSMAGLYGSQQQVIDTGTGKETTVTADDEYLRESILNSGAKLVKGYPPIMPSFRGVMSEEQLLELISYIKSLKVTEDKKSQ